MSLMNQALSVARDAAVERDDKERTRIRTVGEAAAAKFTERFEMPAMWVDRVEVGRRSSVWLYRMLVDDVHIGVVDASSENYSAWVPCSQCGQKHPVDLHSTWASRTATRSERMVASIGAALISDKLCPDCKVRPCPTCGKPS